MKCEGMFDLINPEFSAIYEGVCEDIGALSSLAASDSGLIAAAVCAGLGSETALKGAVKEALAAGCAAAEIEEALFHAALYIGYPRALDACAAADEVFLAEGIELPRERRAAVSGAAAEKRGEEIQDEIFGREGNEAFWRRNIDNGHEYINRILKVGLGSTYSRSPLDLRRRELITLALLAAMGGAEDKLASHIRGAMNVGLSREDVESVFREIMPLAGFPRMSRAIDVLDRVMKER